MIASLLADPLRLRQRLVQGLASAVEVQSMIFRAENDMGRDGKSLNLLHLVEIVPFHSCVFQHGLVLHLHDLRVVLFLNKHHALLLHLVGHARDLQLSLLVLNLVLAAQNELLI